MLQIVSADSAFDSSALQTPGGFAWWYLDLSDDRGDGLVVIWFFGLPFLPTYSKNTVRPIASSRPGICIAVYRGYKQLFYLLQEDLAGSALFGPNSSEVAIGSNRFYLEHKGETTSVSADIDTCIPGSRDRLVGTVRAQGPRLRGLTDGVPNRVHTWSPILTSALGEARLRIDERELFDLRGRVYVDRNASSEPLSELGITQWHWGHLAFADRELLFYELLPVNDYRDAPLSIVLTIGRDGITEIRHSPIQWSGNKRDRYGLKWHRWADLSSPDKHPVRVHFRSLVDNGPFYLRFLIEGVDNPSGQTGYGFAELVKPDRIDLAAMRLFIQMRIHRKQGPNSLFLPFFSGENRGRWGRCFSHWADVLGPTRKRP
jgi:hypothetical protein